MLKKFGNSLFWIQHTQIRLDDISKDFYSHSLQKCKKRALIN